jgi:general secretion pathway protein L
MRRWFVDRPALTAEPVAGGGYRFTRDGRTVMGAQGRAGRATPVTLRLPREAALVREVPTPSLPARDLRRMLELDIDRLTPFRSDQVYVDVAPGEHRSVVAAIPRDMAAAAYDEARAAGLEPRALGLAAASEAERSLDFLPKMREAGDAPKPSSNRMLIWAAVVVLALANLGVAVGRDMLELRALSDKVEAQQPMVDRVVAVRRHVLKEEQRRADIIARRTGSDPLRMLDAVSAATPNGAWVDRLAFDGRSVRLSGYRQDQVDMAAALRAAPLLTNIRSSGGDLLTRQAAGQPFDLTADLKTAPTTISTLPGGGG